jgi:hypothetical protein
MPSAAIAGWPASTAPSAVPGGAAAPCKGPGEERRKARGRDSLHATLHNPQPFQRTLVLPPPHTMPQRDAPVPARTLLPCTPPGLDELISTGRRHNVDPGEGGQGRKAGEAPRGKGGGRGTSNIRYGSGSAGRIILACTVALIVEPDPAVPPPTLPNPKSPEERRRFPNTQHTAQQGTNALRGTQLTEALFAAPMPCTVKGGPRELPRFLARVVRSAQNRPTQESDAM